MTEIPADWIFLSCVHDFHGNACAAVCADGRGFLQIVMQGDPLFQVIVDRLDVNTEKKLAPLPDYRDKPADRWAGYTVTKHTEPQVSSHFLCASPDLQDESLSRHQLATVKG